MPGLIPAVLAESSPLVFLNNTFLRETQWTVMKQRRFVLHWQGSNQVFTLHAQCAAFKSVLPRLPRSSKRNWSNRFRPPSCNWGFTVGFLSLWLGTAGPSILERRPGFATLILSHAPCHLFAWENRALTSASLRFHCVSCKKALLESRLSNGRRW